MTQKELMYFEDAVGHEDVITKIIETSLKNIEDENISSFMEKELTKHTEIKENLMNLLEEKQNG